MCWAGWHCAPHTWTRILCTVSSVGTGGRSWGGGRTSAKWATTRRLRPSPTHSTPWTDVVRMCPDFVEFCQLSAMYASKRTESDMGAKCVYVCWRRRRRAVSGWDPAREGGRCLYWWGADSPQQQTNRQRRAEGEIGPASKQGALGWQQRQEEEPCLCSWRLSPLSVISLSLLANLFFNRSFILSILSLFPFFHSFILSFLLLSTLTPSPLTLNTYAHAWTKRSRQNPSGTTTSRGRFLAASRPLLLSPHLSNLPPPLPSHNSNNSSNNRKTSNTTHPAAVAAPGPLQRHQQSNPSFSLTTQSSIHI